MAKPPADRGAKDDWEALQMILNEHQGLKQRVLHRIRALRSMSAGRDKGVEINNQKTQDSQKDEKEKK